MMIAFVNQNITISICTPHNYISRYANTTLGPPFCKRQIYYREGIISEAAMDCFLDSAIFFILVIFEVPETQSLLLTII
jgi:hypothetical protein